MKKRAEIRNPERLEEYLRGPDRSPDCKASVLRLAQKLDIAQVAEWTGVPVSALYHWIHQWNETGDLTNRRGQGADGNPMERRELSAFW